MKCPGTGKMPNLECDKELAPWQARCNKCTIVLKYRKRKRNVSDTKRQ